MTQPDVPVPDELDGEGPGVDPGPGADLGPGAAQRNTGTESAAPATDAPAAGGHLTGESHGEGDVLPRGEH